jgi:pyruvate dehydrogenase E1 component alpha subunit
MTVDTSRKAAGPPGHDQPDEPELVQLLTPEGERVPHEEYDPLIADITDEDVRGFYRDLVLSRRVDTEAVALQRHGELGLWASLLGQEAAQVGSARALRPQDHVFPTYREHGVAWCRGVDPGQLLGLFRGVDQGSWDPRENNFHLYTIVIGAQTLHATGYAMGIQRDGAVGTGDEDRDAAVIAYFGDGAASQGDVNEAFNWAATMSLPILFVCQNNQWAISTPTSKQFGAPLHARAAGFGLRSWWVDGNDALAVHAVTQEAVDSIRAGQGPALVEAETYRVGGHSTSDDPKRYRTEEELAGWRARDPLARLRVLLGDLGVAAQWFDEVDDEGRALATRTREECRSLQGPDLAELFAEVYSEPHPVAQERAALESFRSLVESGA